MLVSVAAGGLFGYSGQRILVEGDTFVNTLVGYDQFTPGTNFQSSQLQPYSVQLDKFQITFDRESKGKFGQPIDFKADVTTKENPDAPAKKEVLKVNDPLSLGGTSIYLTGNGYAPVVTVRDGARNIAMQGPVVANYRATTTTPRGHQGPGRQAGAARLRQLLPADAFVTDKACPSAATRTVQPAADPELVLRRPRPGRRCPPKTSRLDVKKLTPLDAGSLDADGMTLARGAPAPCRRQGLHQLRRREALRRCRPPSRPGRSTP